MDTVGVCALWLGVDGEPRLPYRVGNEVFPVGLQLQQTSLGDHQIEQFGSNLKSV